MKCPSCEYENIAGVDRCENCMKSLQDFDVPRPREGLQAHIMMDPVRAIYSSDPASVTPDDSVETAVDAMRQRHAGCVLVMQNGRLEGILSEVDLLFKLQSDRIDSLRVGDLMTAAPECVPEDASMAFALRMMSVGGYRHLPVTRDGEVVGILSIKDLLRYFQQQLL